MGTLDRDTAIRAEGERWFATLSDRWALWGPAGGYAAAIALRGAGVVAPPDHRPASMSVQFVSAGAFSDAEVEIVPIKKGRSGWLINVALRQEGRTFLQAQVWTTSKTAGPREIRARPPAIPHHSELKFFGEHVVAHYGDKAGGPPPFWTNLESKPSCWWPFEEAPPGLPRVANWYRFVDFEARDVWLDHARAVVLLDLLIWGAHADGRTCRTDYRAPNLDVNLSFHEAAGSADWLLAESVSEVCENGLIHGASRLWTEDGRPIASASGTLIVMA